MTFKKIILFLFLIFSLFPIHNIYAQITNTGFVSGNIWYSKENFEEGDNIKIHTFVFNPDARELSGTVIFFDKTVMLGKKDFTIPANTAEDVSIDWIVTAGDHNIFGKIENARFLVSKGKYEEVYLAENETEKNTRIIPKKVVLSNTGTNNVPTSSISSSVSDITKIIEEKTPSFISVPVVSTTNALEIFRKSTGLVSENKKQEIKQEIKVLEDNKIKEEAAKDTKSNTKSTTNTKSTSKNVENVGSIKTNSEIVSSSVIGPFKYVELFFLTIFSFIFNNGYAFYIIFILFILFFIRYIWKKIF